MRLKGVPFLVGLLGLTLTIGGVFAAWVFNDGTPEDAEANLELNTSPERRWEFDETLVAFNAGNYNSYVGKFEDGTTEKYMNNNISEALNYSDYSAIITSVPKLYDGEIEVTEYVFSHWTYEEDEEVKEFNFDIAIEKDTVLTAQYISVDNPSIWTFTYGDNSEMVKGEKVAMMHQNIDAEEGQVEFMATNFVVEDDYEERGYHYLVEYQETKYPCINSSTDSVVKGFYTVYFNTVARDASILEWGSFGGHVYFQRQYHFALMGNPNNGWNVTEDTQYFGYMSEVKDGDNVIKTYKLDKVLFRDDVLNSDSTVNFDFKPYEPNFNIWPHIKSSETTDHPHMDPGTDSESKKYVRKHQDTSNDNLTLVADVVQRVFTMEIDVTFGQPGNNYIINATPASYVPGEYPYYITVRMKPYTASVHFYHDDKITEYKSVEVNYGQKVDSGIYNDYPASKILNVVEPDVLLGKQWVDLDTGEVIEFSTLDVTKNQYVYPEYTKRTWTATVHYMTTWSSNSWNENTSITTNLYDGEKINPNMLGNLATPKTGYSLKGWQYSTSSSGITSTTYESAANIVANHDFTGDVYIYPIFMANLVYKQSSSFYPVTSGNEYTISSSSINVGRNHVLGTTLYTNDGSKSLTTSSGIYKLTYSSSWTITRKIGFQNEDTSSWGQSNARYSLYAFNSTANKWYDLGKGTNITFWAYIDYTYTTVIFCRMNPSTTDNNWNNGVKWNQSSDTLLTSGYSSSTPCYYKWSNNTSWDEWTNNYGWGNGN